MFLTNQIIRGILTRIFGENSERKIRLKFFIANCLINCLTSYTYYNGAHGPDYKMLPTSGNNATARHGNITNIPMINIARKKLTSKAFFKATVLE
jgi:hypothetical protein